MSEQLSLKAVLLRILGLILRGHGIRGLLGSLSKALEGFGKIELSYEKEQEISRDVFSH